MILDHEACISDAGLFSVGPTDGQADSRSWMPYLTHQRLGLAAKYMHQLKCVHTMPSKPLFYAISKAL